MSNLINTNQEFMKKLFWFFSVFIFIMVTVCALNTESKAQEIIVNEFQNFTDVRDEWSELLVIQDNLDLQNYTFSDNASTTDCFQARIRFKSGQALWTHLRAGTTIVIWHRPCNSSGTSHPTDLNSSDGYIELDATNSTYFDYPDIGSTICSGSITLSGMFSATPCATNGGNTLNLANGGDLLQIKDASGNHVHALGYDDTPGSSWTGLSTSDKALMHNNTLSSGDGVRIATGADLAHCYGAAGDFSEWSTSRTSKSSSNITFGLPNSCGSCLGENSLFWRLLREPAIAMQTVTATWTSGAPGSISFTWTGATDPYATDATTGYLVLRNTSNSFTAPTDGTTYTNGATLGTATVLTHITSSSTVTYTDNTVTNGNQYFYRVYAYRLGTDANNGNSYDVARGRAYQTTNYVSTSIPSPLPVELIYFDAKKKDTEVQLTWSTASEINSDKFVVERANDVESFSELLSVPGAGYSTTVRNYEEFDFNPIYGKNYYRLKQIDFDGKFSYSKIRTIDFDGSISRVNNIYKTEEGKVKIESDLNDTQAEVFFYDAAGRLLQKEKISLNDGSTVVDFNKVSTGIYFVKVVSENTVLSGKLIF